MTDDEALARIIGQRLNAIRLQRRQTLQAVASALGITYQQVRKYETGQNRISASTLYRVARVLDVDVALFFDELEWRTERSDTQPASRQDDLAEALNRVEDLNVRHRLGDLINLLSIRG